MNAVKTFIKNATRDGLKIQLKGADICIVGRRDKLPSSVLDYIRKNKLEIVKALSPSKDPPMPKSVCAMLDFLHRTKFKKEPSEKMKHWLATDQRISRYEKACFDQEHACHSKNATAAIL